MKRLAGWSGWLALLLLATWLLADRETHRAGEGDVWLAYVLEPGGSVSLAVTGGTSIRVQMWLETPAAWATDPRATHPVQLGWRAFDLVGEELASGAPWTSSRAGWALPEQPDDPLLPVAVGPRYDRQVADPRTFEVDVPEATARLELTALHLPRGGRALVVAFEEGTRDTVDQVRFVVGADAERAEKAAARMGPWGWDEMPLDWRQRASRSLWRRLASVSQADRPVRVASADAWLPMDDAAALGFAVPPGGAAAYNLEGEVVFDARWTAPDGREPRPTRTWLEVVGEGLGEVKDLGRVTEVGPLTFPPGTREVRIARDPFDEEGPTLLRASTTGPMRDRAWGDPPRLELEGGAQRLGPDLTGLIYWRADAGRPLLFGLPADHEIRVVARPRLPPGRLPGLGPAEPEPSGAVVLERVGRDRWTRDLPIAAIASPYERYTQGDDPSSARVSEETEWYLASTPDPSALLVWSQGPVDVQVFVKERAAPSDVPEPGYPVESLAESLRARYLPYARRTWRARYPAGVEELARQGRAIRIDAQVRWTWRSTGGASGLEYRVLELPPPFELVAEPKEGGTRNRLRREEQTLVIPPTGRLLVDYRVPPDRVGKEVTFTFEGRKDVRELLSAAGTLRFERLPPGPLRVAVRGPGVFLANAPGPQPWAVRRMWLLEPGRARTIPVPPGGEGLSVHVARRKDESHGALVWRLVGEGVDGLPVADRRREGRIALSTSAGPAEVMSRVEDTWTNVEPLRLWLGSRLEGAAALELSLEERDDPVWIWVSSTWATGAAPLDERHWAIPGVGGPMILLGLALATTPWERTGELRVRDADALVVPDVTQRAELGALVRDLVRAAPSGAVPAGLPERASALGLSLDVSDGIALLGSNAGWGLLAVRLGPASPWVVQAPHPWFDLGTGELTGLLFAESDARAALFATTHRKLADTTDAAHQAEGGFQTLTLALVDALEDPVLVQIHGFGGGHTGADVVVGGWGAASLTEGLTTLGWVAADGKAVPSLAGSTNLQVRALAGRAPVAHLELNKATRTALRDDPALRARLWAVLKAWAR